MVVDTRLRSRRNDKGLAVGAGSQHLQPSREKKQVPVRLLRDAQSLRAGSHPCFARVWNDIIGSLAMKSRFLLARFARASE
jgi:hypothetical protein